MKFKLKTEGMTGEALALATALNTKFEELPEASSPQEVQQAMNDKFKDLMGEDGKFKVITKAEFDAEILKQEDIIKAQGLKITELEQHSTRLKEKSLVELIEAEIPAFKKIKESGTGSVPIKIKSAAVTAIGSGGSIANDISAATGLRLFPDAQFFEIKRGTPFILDFVNVGTRDLPFIIWWDEVAHQGDFAITAEGVVKPLIQYKFDKKSSDYRKSAAYSTITDEFWNDMAALVTQIKRLGQIDLMNSINAQILTDMIAALPGFTYTALNGKVYHADDYAAIGAAIAQIQALFFTPTVLVLNPADAWKMKLTKDDVGRYQMPPFAMDAQGKTFEFGQVIVDPRIAVGFFLLGDGMTFNVDFRGDIIIRIGYNGNDFITNEQTVVVERYFFDYISTNRLGAWVYGQFATIKGLINDETNS